MSATMIATTATTTATYSTRMRRRSCGSQLGIWLRLGIRPAAQTETHLEAQAALEVQALSKARPLGTAAAERCKTLCLRCSSNAPPQGLRTVFAFPGTSWCIVGALRKRSLACDLQHAHRDIHVPGPIWFSHWRGAP